MVDINLEHPSVINQHSPHWILNGNRHGIVDFKCTRMTWADTDTFPTTIQTSMFWAPSVFTLGASWITSMFVT